MRRLGLALALCAVSAILPARAQAPKYERVDATVPMSDGVTLDASVYLPTGAAAGAELPLIVRQHGGGSNKDNDYDVGYGLDFVETGRYAVLLYSHRGHGGSGGAFDFFGERTTKDFSEMVDWVETRFGSTIDTERVGASGYSQGGGESLLPAAFDARVRAVAVGQTFADLEHALNPEDCFKLTWATGIFAAAYKASQSRTQDELAVRWGATLYTDTEDVGSPSTADDLRARSPASYADVLAARRVPVFWAQAWEDQLFPGDHPAMLLEPLRAAGVPVHYWFSSGGHARGPNFAAEETAREAAMRAWMDEHLLGEARGFAAGPLVDYWQRQTAGRPGTWVHRTAAEWPVPATPSRWWLNPGSSLSPDRVLSEVPVAVLANDYAAANVANDDILAEVAGRVPGLGDLQRAVPESANPLDSATFVGVPLDEALDVTGSPVVRIEGGSSARRVYQVSAKVWDVAPDDSATLVWRGCTSFEQPDVTDPARDPVLTLWPNSHRFEPGHRIALTVAAVDAPFFKPDVEPQATTISSGSVLELPSQ